MIIQPFFETKAEVSLAYGIVCPEKQINAFMALQPSSGKVGSQSGCDPKTHQKLRIGLKPRDAGRISSGGKGMLKRRRICIELHRLFLLMIRAYTDRKTCIARHASQDMHRKTCIARHALPDMHCKIYTAKHALQTCIARHALQDMHYKTCITRHALQYMHLQTFIATRKTCIARHASQDMQLRVDVN